MRANAVYARIHTSAPQTQKQIGVRPTETLATNGYEWVRVSCSCTKAIYHLSDVTMMSFFYMRCSQYRDEQTTAVKENRT